MQYVSSFIHVPVSDGRMAAIDVKSITLMVKPNARYCDGKTKVYHDNDGHIEVLMDREKLVDLVEDKRRELWMNERAAQIESSKLMITLIETVGVLSSNSIQKASNEIDKMGLQLPDGSNL
ncbi:hypothetical protein pETSU_142 [Edwardsiella phage pEt-SU]|uniref:Uncharacterized protein n=1 Tax=Edwardsiella phage pEt-SU TaxID=2562142 RepID=A0A4D6DWL6_9CAUD|nr:hypothetical protein HOV39_gp142 [Edwardsiella phage pEt-SU]QBZ70723.1 hypothetical protein pETSU_142 [Edwardsiella phage pEt-SU]